jgi:uncharacterized membrane protein HdeD (DUF308 family)
MNQDTQHATDVLPGGSAAGLPVGRVIEHELRHLRQEWWWFLLLGILLVVSGTVAIAYPLVGTVAVVAVLGMSLLVSGVATIVTAFWVGRWSGYLLLLLIGLLYTAVGFLMLDDPLKAAGGLTLVVATLFVVVGIMRSVAAIVLRFPQWGWSLLSGLLTTLVGLMIYKSFPAAALWAIGILVGIQLIFDGWYWIMLGMALWRLPVART